ncbi:Acyl-CoA N-acyltransferases (Nat) [Venustampulla echinocandica]|uniref:Acyl-CoA N-acyltransferases (Nat) n=1 Tax=Venustampulla echinocandica TaxID=2656787 RepID=A0A370T8S9_9HELO|nr:Acyl-CoA N-acyltransferases (Nat) [Venustampulla echinocandica]RDL29903.1 Acyl-CoA N-acyltransferases (Nat) [Venustampulla echinocandica]
MAAMAMDGLFRSARLIYRTVEDTPEDEAFMHTIQSDVDAMANSDSGLLKPMTLQDSRKHKDYVANKTLLGVIICLAPPAARAGTPSLAAPIAPVPIGSIYLTAPKPGEAHHRHSYISIDIIAAYQRKGYGSEAIDWVMDWGFRIAGLHRIGIEAFSYNQGARELYERLGFVYEGCKRELLWFNGGWHDFLSFSILDHEWKARQERKLATVSKDTKKE